MKKKYTGITFQRFWNVYSQPYAYLLPALFIFIFITFLPVMLSLILSFYHFTGYDTNIFKEFVGFDNFKILFNDKYFWISFKNTLLFVGASISIQVLIALITAITIFFGKFKYSSFIRSIIFFPAVLAPVSISLAWRKIFQQDGVINRILGIDFPWLSNVHLAIWIVIFVSIWQWFGYNMIIFYAGLQSVDRSILEAADVDGASWWGKIFKIVIPLLVPVIILNVILNLIGNFRVFDIVFVLTRGGPVHQSEVFTTIMYYYSFASVGPNKMGVGSSIAFIMFAIMVIFGIIRIRLLRKG